MYAETRPEQREEKIQWNFNLWVVLLYEKNDTFYCQNLCWIIFSECGNNMQLKVEQKNDVFYVAFYAIINCYDDGEWSEESVLVVH